MTIYRRFAAVFAVCAGFGVSPASAHNEWGLMHDSVPKADAVRPQQLEQLAQRLPDETGRYVLVRAVLWDPGSTLRGCFYNGSEDAKDRVVRAARTLLENRQVNLTVDFGEGPAYRTCATPAMPGEAEDIRVSFENGCCAAYLGRQAHAQDVLAGGATVFLQGLGEFPETEAQRITMHELLHVLGLHHEHQSPGAPCNFSMEQLRQRFPGRSDETLRVNYKRLEVDERSYRWSTYDPESIMHYYGIPEPCRIAAENMTPSGQDYEGLRDAYPMTVPDEAREDARAAAAPEILAIEGLPDEVRELVEMSTTQQ